LRGIKQLIHRPHGIILIVGPTGSGKTTTLYSALNLLNNGDKNITTVEDPVEYKIEGLTQIQTHSDIGLDFAAVLRSILRQDPDVVLVGEVRDQETTEIAIRAALTGHLVFATLHTNDAAGAIARLTEMGVEPYLISSAVRGAMSQRLLRTICPHCKEQVEARPEMVAAVNPQGRRKVEDIRFFQGKGCRSCFFTGYRGRTVIAELLTVTEALRDKIVRRASTEEVNTQAVADGMRPMFEDGVDKVLSGITTLDEVLKVTEDIK
jgi:type II secretory ATPase GspE/PulE/Tfp pilus assembly ATPase PilB-like protein